MRNLLPSGRFASVVFSFVIAGGIIGAAQYFTAPKQEVSIAATETPAIDTNWQNTLYAIQGNNASSSLPQAPSPEEVGRVLAAAHTDNVTETVSRSLAINLTTAKQQGLGDDTVSQNKIIAQALDQARTPKKATYSLHDLVMVEDSTSTLHAYGNAVMEILQKHPGANMNAALLYIAQATDTNSPASLKKLAPIGKAYAALAQDLLTTPTPRSMTSLHLLVVNDFQAIADTFPGMALLISDPLQGLIAAQQFNALLSEEGRVYTNISHLLQKRSILFSKGEAGVVWRAFQ